MSKPPLQVRKIMVALDMTHVDRLLIQYVQFLTSYLTGLEHIVFFHNIRFDFPEQVAEILEKLDNPLAEKLVEEIEVLANKYLDDNLNWSIEVTQEEDTLEAMLDLYKEEQFDMLMFGKKVSYPGSGYLVERLLNHYVDAHTLVLPESAYHRISNILVPIDFSRKSANALLQANRVANVAGAQLTCQHVYNIPKIYFPYIPVKDLKLQMREDAHKSWQKFLKKHEGLNYMEDISFSFQADRTTSQTIYDHALTRQTDLIVVPAEQSPIRSTVVQLLKLEMHIPLLMVK